MARKHINRSVKLQQPPTRGGTDEMAGLHPKAEPRRDTHFANRILEGLQEKGRTLQPVSHYEIVDTLGEGGMGTVFLGHHISEGGICKEVAIKVLKEGADEKAIQRFVEEAKLLAQLTQGTVVELLALESMVVNLPAVKDRKTGRIRPPRKSKLYYMVQELVKGPSHGDVLIRLQELSLLMTPPMVGFILNKTAIALAEAHDLTLVHRDISPSNILFNAKAGITKLADFGVAKAFTEDEAGGERKLTGKPRYMAPEQLEGYATPASDIWALGVIGYESITGFSPYRPSGKGLMEKADALRQQMKSRLAAPKEIMRNQNDDRFAFDKLSDIVMKCLELDPEKRPTSLELNAMLEGDYLYTKGLGPTNKTLAAYLRLIDYAITGGAVVPPPDYDETEDPKVLAATLRLEELDNAFRRRTSSVYQKEFVARVKGRAENPCLLP